ncbi:MAG: hypothetical protein ABW054_07715 [Casimicrobiaceae bacterium]
MADSIRKFTQFAHYEAWSFCGRLHGPHDRLGALADSLTPVAGGRALVGVPEQKLGGVQASGIARRFGA